MFDRLKFIVVYDIFNESEYVVLVIFKDFFKKKIRYIWLKKLMLKLINKVRCMDSIKIL